MIKLIGEKLRQYDLNRTVELIPKQGHTVDTVMFHRGPEPLMTAHREEDGKIVADIPNILLKSFGTLTVECHLIDENGYRISERASFYISKREMPADYAYEETPILTLGKGGGASSWNDLTDKPFYKEVTVVNEPLNITWDGDTSGKVSAMGGAFFKVSDAVPTNEVLKTATFGITESGNEVTNAVAEFWDNAVNGGYVTEDATMCLNNNDPVVLVVRNVDSEIAAGVQASEAGIYFRNMGHYGYVSSFTTTEPVEQRTETIHPIAPEFLPAGVGGGGMIVKLVIPEDGAPVLDKTYEEIKAALLAGNRVEIHQSISVMPGVVSVYHAAGISMDSSSPICFYCIDPIHSHSPSDAIDISVLRVSDDNTFDVLRPRINVSWL